MAKGLLHSCYESSPLKQHCRACSQTWPWTGQETMMGPGRPESQQPGANWIWPSDIRWPVLSLEEGSKNKNQNSTEQQQYNNFYPILAPDIEWARSARCTHQVIFSLCEDLARHTILTLSSLQLPKKVPDISNTAFPIKKSTFAQKVES